MRMLMTALVAALTVTGIQASSFYDDFEDGDITDWDCWWGENGEWWREEGRLKGTIASGPSGLVPDAWPVSQDMVVSTRVRGVHAFGVAARLDIDEPYSTAGILAYVSTDHDVARIRLLSDGV